MASNKGMFTCPVCSKKMGSSQKFAHLRIHEGVRPFQCRFCEKAFIQKIQCVVHERIHTGETPFPCQYCPEKFKQAANLRHHLMAKHQSEGLQLHLCPICRKPFMTPNSLSRHMKTHDQAPAEEPEMPSPSNAHLAALAARELAGPSGYGHPGGSARSSSTEEHQDNKIHQDEGPLSMKFEMYGQKFVATPHATKKWTVSLAKNDDD